MTAGDRIFELEFDFHEHVLRIVADRGQQPTVALESKPVAAFYAETMAVRADLGLDVTIQTAATG